MEPCRKVGDPDHLTSLSDATLEPDRHASVTPAKQHLIIRTGSAECSAVAVQRTGRTSASAVTTRSAPTSVAFRSHAIRHPMSPESTAGSNTPPHHSNRLRRKPTASSLPRGCPDQRLIPVRCSPAPMSKRGGIEIGSLAVIGASPSSARAAARCEDARPPQATMYVGTVGAWRRA